MSIDVEPIEFIKDTRMSLYVIDNSLSKIPPEVGLSPAEQIYTKIHIKTVDEEKVT